MLLQQLNRSDAEKVFIIVQNAAGATITQGVPVCFDGRSSNSLGNAVMQPQTSNLAAFAGIVDADTAADGFVLCQVYGYRASVVAHVGADSISARGLLLGPATALWSLQSNGRTFAMGPVVCLQNDLSGPGWIQAFVRAL